MQLTLEFGGGLELLCNSVNIHNVKVEPHNGEEKLSMKDLLSWVLTNLIKERPEMFMKGDYAPTIKFIKNSRTNVQILNIRTSGSLLERWSGNRSR